MDKGKSEKEMWNVINDVTKPKSNYSWTLKTNSGETCDKLRIAELFNIHFKTKIDLLKANTDEDLKEDPLAKLNEKWNWKTTKERKYL